MSEKEVDSKFIYPKDFKSLRACMVCHLIKTESEFKKYGCDNCSQFSSSYEIYDYTTANFEGFIALTEPQNSWIARNLNLTNFIKGTYALKVRGELSEIVKQNMDNNQSLYARNLQLNQQNESQQLSQEKRRSL